MKLSTLLKKEKFDWKIDTVSVNGLRIFKGDNFNFVEGDEIRFCQIYKEDVHYKVAYFRNNKIKWISPMVDYYMYS